MSEDAYNSQDKILYQIKRLGPQTAKSLAGYLGMTTMGSRQHLGQMETQGLVRSNEPKVQGRGRPVRTWRLTEQGHGRFPDAHAQVTTELISSVKNLLGDDALDLIIEDRSSKTFALYASELTRHKTLTQKVCALAELRTAEGYMAEVESKSSLNHLLIEQHCPICIAAAHCQGFCRTELELFVRLFDGVASVIREEYLLDGARRCTYRIEALTQ